MKITPLDIQQKQFRVRFRGFEMVEVDDFLDLVADEFEELLQENNRLKEEERQKTQKIQELEGAGRDLRNALISGQQSIEEIKDNARKEGELISEEAKAQAQKILETAQVQAMQVETEIPQLKRRRAEVEATLRGILEMHMKLVDTRAEGQCRPGHLRKKGRTSQAKRDAEKTHRGSESRTGENLERWKASGEPKRWVVIHNYSWNHNDWSSLLEALKKSDYWPMNPDDVGTVLEEEKRSLV